MPTDYKHVSIREAQGGFIVNFYVTDSAVPMPSTDVTAIFTDLDSALAYVKNVLAVGATNQPPAINISVDEEPK